MGPLIIGSSLFISRTTRLALSSVRGDAVGVFTVAEMNPDLSVVGDIGVDSYPHVGSKYISTGDAAFVDDDRDQPSNLVQTVSSILFTTLDVFAP